MTNADKQWCELENDGQSTFFESNVTLDDMWIPNTLIDQLRRDAVKEGYKKGVLEQFTTISKVTKNDIQRAKKELFDEFYRELGSDYETFRLTKANTILEKLRTKTLGEKRI